jgi:hypothetical protein
MSGANPIKAPKVRPHFSLGQRPRITEKSDSSPEGACHFPRWFWNAPSGLIPPYPGVPGRCPRLSSGRAVGALMGFASLMLFFKTGFFLDAPLISHTSVHPPIITVGKPRTMLPPWAVESPIRAAGLPPIKTVAEPLTMESGGPTQTHISPITAAGIPPMMTVGTPGPSTGPPTWGIGGSPGVTMGHTWRSVSLAAGGMEVSDG